MVGRVRADPVLSVGRAGHEAQIVPGAKSLIPQTINCLRQLHSSFPGQQWGYIGNWNISAYNPGREVT